MIKRLRVVLLLVVVVVVGLSTVQYLWIVLSPNDKGQLYKVYREIWRDQKPVNLTVHAVDQFGESVPKYKVLVTMRSVSWYFRIFPLWAQHYVNYELETDQRGTGKLALWLRRAYDMRFKEVDASQYIFPEGDKSSIGDLMFDPKSGFMLKGVNGTGQVINMKLLRHDPPVKLVGYHPETPGRGAIGMRSPGIEAQDEMVFTVDVTGNKFLEGRQDGDILITVKNAKTACEMFTKIYTPNLDFKEEGEWDVSFEALSGTRVQRAESNQLITFAPETGYKERLNYVMAIKMRMRRPEAPDFEGPNGEHWKIARAAADEECYASIGSLEMFRACLYLKHDNPRWYGIVTLGFGLMYREGRLRINADGVFNPGGSTNLWTGHPFSPAWGY
jgi:hypothetical protein